MTTADDEDPPQPLPVRWPLWIAGGILAVVAVVNLRPGLWDRLQPSRQRDLTEVHLGVLVDSIGMYHLDHHALPQTLEDLLQKDARTGERYILRIPRDPWRHPYMYRILNEGRGQFEVRSVGEDGIVETDDDVVKTTEAVK